MQVPKRLEIVLVEHMLDTLRKVNGNQGYAARLLNIGTNKFTSLMNKAEKMGYKIPSPKVTPLEDVELKHIVATLQYTEGRRLEACKILGISESTLQKRISRALNGGICIPYPFNHPK